MRVHHDAICNWLGVHGHNDFAGFKGADQAGPLLADKSPPLLLDLMSFMKYL